MTQQPITYQLSEMSIDPSALQALRARIQGVVAAPGDQQYDALRTPWHLHLKQYPAVVVAAADPSEERFLRGCEWVWRSWDIEAMSLARLLASANRINRIEEAEHVLSCSYPGRSIASLAVEIHGTQ